jgi:glycerophosphoryl diester phosphodiesterase
MKEEFQVKPVIYAHRGASGRFPENTMYAYRAALRHGADGIEIDVQLSRDQEVVVIHDSTLERTTNGSGMVQNYTSAELRKLSAGSWFHPKFRPAKIPRLKDILSFIQPTSLKLLIELKNFFLPQPELEEKVVQLVQQSNLVDRVIISSFNFNSLLRIKELIPEMRTGLLYIGHLREPWEIAKQFRTDELHVPKTELTPALILESKKCGLKVIGWTINSRQRIQQAVEMGVDGIITNYPLRAVKIVKGTLS